MSYHLRPSDVRPTVWVVGKASAHRPRRVVLEARLQLEPTPFRAPIINKTNNVPLCPKH